MDEPQNSFQPETEKPEVVAEAPKLNPEIAAPTTAKSKNMKLMMVLTAVLLAVIGGLVWFLMKDKSDKTDTKPTSDTTASVEEAPVEEEALVEEDADCADGYSQFADEEFGAKFCYPEEWGTASVMDAKVDDADTGHREAVRFSVNTKFIAGGTSEDWSTTVGRGVGCQEPNNSVPELSSYDTEWHDFIGSGMAIEFATRSLESSEGGYDMTESVSNLLESGVCVQGHKVIDGSRYRVLSAAFFSDFSESAGITSPKTHIDNPNVLFSATERQQFDELLASAEAY